MKLISFFTFIILSLQLGHCAENILSWRGDNTGRYPKATPVTSWSESENVIWRCAMPSPSNSSPTLVDGKIFIFSELTDLLCIDAGKGTILWKANHDYDQVYLREVIEKTRAENAGKIEEMRKNIHSHTREINRLRKEDARKNRKQIIRMQREINGFRDRMAKLRPYELPQAHSNNGYSSHIPVSDGKHVYSIFGNGVVSCHTLEGKKVWMKFVKKSLHTWGHSASPVVTRNALIVNIGNSLFALDLKTGEEIWQTPCKDYWGTSVLWDEQTLIHPNGWIYDLASGKGIIEMKGRLTYASPVISGDIAYFIESRAKAIRIPKDPRREKPQTLWSQKVKGSRHYSSILHHEGLVYVVSHNEVLSVLEADSGKQIYTQKLGMYKNKNSIYSSVTLGGKYIFIGSEGGTMLVLEPGKTYKEVARNKLDLFRSTPIFAGKRMYLRTLKYMYCIGKDT